MAPKGKAAAAGKAVDTEAKKLAPPTAAACVLCDHKNSRVLMRVFERVKKEKDDEGVERLAHTMALATRMHNQAVTEALLPLVSKLDDGEALAASLSGKVMEVERLLQQLDSTKKHLGNKEFVQLMGKKKKACEAQMAEEEDVLMQMMEEVDEADLMQAAQRMESVKISAPLLPQVAAEQ